jgi:hypothetical protein
MVATHSPSTAHSDLLAMVADSDPSAVATDVLAAAINSLVPQVSGPSSTADDCVMEEYINFSSSPLTDPPASPVTLPIPSSPRQVAVDSMTCRKGKAKASAASVPGSPNSEIVMDVVDNDNLEATALAQACAESAALAQIPAQGEAGPLSVLTAGVDWSLLCLKTPPMIADAGADRQSVRHVVGDEESPANSQGLPNEGGLSFVPTVDVDRPLVRLKTPPTVADAGADQQGNDNMMIDEDVSASPQGLPDSRKWFSCQL